MTDEIRAIPDTPAVRHWEGERVGGDVYGKGRSSSSGVLVPDAGYISLSGDSSRRAYVVTVCDVTRSSFSRAQTNT